MAWFGQRQSARPGEAELFRMRQGQEVGERARELYARGVLVSTEAETRKRMADGKTGTLFEAKFSAGAWVARADLLRRRSAGWEAIEVKSSFADTGKVGQYIDDLAYTVMVMQLAGVAVSAATLLLLSREYRHGGPVQELFARRDVTEAVLARASEFAREAEGRAALLLGEERPEAALVAACRECPQFASECLGRGVAPTVLELPQLKTSAMLQWGVVAMAEIPPRAKLNGLQERAKMAALSGNVVFTRELGYALSRMEWPCYYLDFETVATTLPLYAGHGCHQQVLTQYSLHVRPGLDGAVEHFEYLAEAGRECERELAERLVAALGEAGSIVVYSPYEKSQILRLAERFADLAEPLGRIARRLVDLLPIVMHHVYHPEFGGSFSIKKVLPALVPELSYAGLAVGDGSMAITRFAQMARGEISGEASVRVTRAALLEYCRLDTLAMVRLHAVLAERAAARVVS
jgi:hypothetical protein